MRLEINQSSPNTLLERKSGKFEPVSPSAQYLNSEALCVSILAVFESEIPIDDSTLLATLENLFLPINHRFSSVMTVNDAITGIIFYGLQLYLQSTSEKQVKPKNITALVLLNTRAIKAYQPLEKMTDDDKEVPWGNHFTFLHVSIPTSGNIDEADPLESIRQIKQIIKAKRNSLGVYITAGILELIRKIKGPQAVSNYISDTLRSTSLAISNLIGPTEKMQMANHPIRSFYFMMARAPQSLTVTVVSYAGTLKVAIGAERNYIDSKLLVHCMEKSFRKIFEAALGK